MPGIFFGSKISGLCIFLGLQYEAPSDPPVMYTSSTPPGSAVLPSTTWFKQHTKRKMAPYTKPSKVKKKFQGASSLIVQKREISQKHSR